jgi:hypothetical protein
MASRDAQHLPLVSLDEHVEGRAARPPRARSINSSSRRLRRPGEMFAAKFHSAGLWFARWSSGRTRIPSGPTTALLAWSLTPSLPALPPLPGQFLVNFEGVPAAGVDIQLTLRGWQPVEVELRGIDGAPATGPEVRALGERLPDWVNLTTYSYHVARVKI